MIKKILIVNDDHAPLESLSMILGSVYELDMAEDGTEALEKLKESRYDLIITDTKMPRMNGDKLISIIRKDIDKDVPIIIMAGYIAEPYHEMLKKGLISACISMPYSSMEAVNTIKLLISDDCGHC